eukprot:9447842-Alexandrium_andersonii.AAC.1
MQLVAQLVLPPQRCWQSHALLFGHAAELGGICREWHSHVHGGWSTGSHGLRWQRGKSIVGLALCSTP